MNTPEKALYEKEQSQQIAHYSCDFENENCCVNDASVIRQAIAVLRAYELEMLQEPTPKTSK